MGRIAYVDIVHDDFYLFLNNHFSLSLEFFDAVDVLFMSMHLNIFQIIHERLKVAGKKYLAVIITRIDTRYLCLSSISAKDKINISYTLSN